MGQCLGCVQVDQSTVAIRETFGKFDDVLEPGCHCLPWCLGSAIAGHLSLRLQQLDVRCETKTKDNVFVTVVASIQYRALADKASDAFYKLSNTRGQIQSYVFDVIRASVPKLDLDSTFEQKNDIAKAVEEELEKAMSHYGFEIVQTLIVDIEPDEHVKRAMNEINAAARMRLAATEKAEAEKILQIKRAEGEAESKYLSGLGIARQRQAIVDGLRDSVLAFSENVPGTSSKDVMDMVLVTQYFDTMKEIGASSKSNSVFIPHGPGAVKDIASQIRDGLLQGNSSRSIFSFFSLCSSKPSPPPQFLFHFPQTNMVKGPGLYSDIGKKARDLLYRDYQTDHKFTVTTLTASGVAITSSGIKKGDLLLGDVSTQLKNKNITTDVKVDTNSNLLATITVDEPAPGLKAILSFIVPDQKSARVELQYQHEYAGISTSLGLTANPVINFSGVVGNAALSLGTDVSFDTASGNLTKLNAGLNFIHTDLIASLLVNDKGDTLTASYYQTVSPITCTAVGAELSHSFSSNENTFTIGTQHALDPLTSVKARVNNYGRASALIQHEWRPKSLFTISGEVDTRAIEKSAKIGLALALKP
ncbi:hypothetical protein ACLB2K_033811 [Fragaria x ananassa]